MKPEQLIAEVEAALHQGESHDWRLLAPLVIDALKAMQTALERLIVERDEALARNAFLHNETGKALEIIASRIELNPPISAEEQIDIEAVAQWVKAIGAEQVDRLMKERDEARAELAKAGESIRAYERMIDGVAEKASALACEQVKAEFLRRDTIARLQAAEIEALKNELARLTTPRPIEEAPKDGTWIVGLWPQLSLTPEVLRWAGSRGWEREVEEDDAYYAPTHFLPLPVKP